jgi:hypothetical protein
MLSKSVRSFAILAALFGGAAVLPSSVSAQSSGTADSVAAAARTPTVAALAPVATTSLALMAGPRIAPAGIIRLQQLHPLGLAESRDESAHVGAGSNLALMGTGAAAVVVGLMIGGSGGNAVAVGGGILGLVGLYRYIR